MGPNQASTTPPSGATSACHTHAAAHGRGAAAAPTSPTAGPACAGSGSSAPDHEPRMRRGEHHDRQQHVAAVLQRDLLRWEPQVALRRVTGQPGQPVRRVDRYMLGRSRRTCSRNQLIDPVQPTRSAITVAGMSGVAAKSWRTNGSNGANAVATAGRSYFGGRSEASARATVDRPTQRSFAT